MKIEAKYNVYFGCLFFFFFVSPSNFSSWSGEEQDVCHLPHFFPFSVSYSWKEYPTSPVNWKKKKKCSLHLNSQHPWFCNLCFKKGVVAGGVSQGWCGGDDAKEAAGCWKVWRQSPLPQYCISSPKPYQTHLILHPHLSSIPVGNNKGGYRKRLFKYLKSQLVNFGGCLKQGGRVIGYIHPIVKGRDKEYEVKRGKNN